MKTTIFYFSATGNSLYVARELAKLLGDVTLVPINAQTIKQEHSLPLQVGFVFPVYFCGIPNLVRDFIQALNISPKTYVFSISTFAGGDYLSHQQIDELLMEKQVKLSYHAFIVMPGNYQLMYPTASKEKQIQLFTKAKAKLGCIAEEINKQQVKPFKHKVGILAKMLGYYYRKMYQISGGKDYNFIVTEACIRCGLCAKVCPVNNISMQDGKPVWQGQCQLCLACLHWCPSQAIQYQNKTAKKGRYHHPEITAEDISPNQA